MKIHAFKVEPYADSQNLEQVLAIIMREQSLRERIRVVGQIDLRMEDIRQVGQLWLMDFVRMRYDHGPGRVSPDHEVEGFDFEDDEGFGEETAALYDPATEYVLVQYNHYGVRAGVISNYLGDYNKSVVNDYTFKPKFDAQIERRLAQQGITRKLEFTIDVGRMSAEDRRQGRPVADAIQYGRRTNADKVKIEISVSGDRGRSLGQHARDSINSLKEILGANPDAVTKLKVSGKDDRDASTEVLDLIGHRLTQEFDDLTLGADLRYSRDERWRALQRAHRGWRDVLV